MRHLRLAALAAAGLCAFANSANAETIVNFDAVALRPANDGSGEYGTITEWANENGVTAQIPKAGQKVYYGTEYFNGWNLSDLDYLEFTYKRANGGNNPYTNAVITDGAGNYGIISSQGGHLIWEIVTDQYTERRMRYYFAGNSGNDPYGFRFYEPAPEPVAYWGHGTNIVWSDISTWTLLGVGVDRPLYSGEEMFGSPVPRGPVTHGLAILWGDSQDNYLGDRDIYDVAVSAGGELHVAGVVPEPATVINLAVLALFGAAAGCRRWRRKRS